jgi:hypothetical protein
LNERRLVSRRRGEDAVDVTRAEAEARREALREAHPEHLFAVRQDDDGGWEVVEAHVSGVEPRSGELHSETRAGPDTTPDPSEDQSPPVWAQRGF